MTLKPSLCTIPHIPIAFHCSLLLIPDCSGLPSVWNSLKIPAYPDICSGFSPQFHLATHLRLVAALVQVAGEKTQALFRELLSTAFYSRQKGIKRFDLVLSRFYVKTIKQGGCVNLEVCHSYCKLYKLKACTTLSEVSKGKEGKGLWCPFECGL